MAVRSQQHHSSNEDTLLHLVSTPVEVLALAETFALVEQANLSALAVSLAFPNLAAEAGLLQRLAYKNTNQHRASKHLQAVSQLLRILKLLRQLQLPGLLQQLHAAAQRTSLPEAPGSRSSNKRAKRGAHHKAPPSGATSAAGAHQQRQAVLLPSFAAGCFVLRRLLCGAQLLLDLHAAVVTAGQHLSGQLSRGYFMPFCLVAAGAAARIRVLGTTALLELLQAYNSVAQLLPLLPAAAAAPPPAAQAAAMAAGSATGLPQILQLAWDGPLPALRSVLFEEQGPQSLQGLAAQLQQTFCISSASGSAGGGTMPAVGAGEHATTAEAGDVLGVAISRDDYALQQAAAEQQPRLRRQQHQRSSAPAVTISVFEDKQPQPAGAAGPAAASAQQAPLLQLQQQQQQQAAVPLYTTVPGLGFSLGEQGTSGPTLSVLLGAAAGAGAGAGAAPHHQPVQADSTMAAAEDQDEFLALYGSQPTTAAGTQQQQQVPAVQPPPQQPPQGLRTAGAAHAAAAAGTRRVQASAGLLAMQAAHSSDDDDGDDDALQQLPSQAQHPTAQLSVALQPSGQGAAPQLLAPSQPPPIAQAAVAPSAASLVDAAAEAPAAADVSGSSAAPAALLLSKRGKQQKKQGKQAKAAGPGERDAAPAKKDAILDMLLQGL